MTCKGSVSSTTLMLTVLLWFVACDGKPTLEKPPDDVTSSDQCNEAWAAGFQADHCEMVDSTSPPISPLYWPDVCTPNLQGWTPTQSSFDQLSWRSFLYANWPADSSGQPDTSKRIGAQDDGVFLPTVWQTFKSAQDLIGAGAATLTADDYSTPSSVPDGCDFDGPRVLTMSSKIPEPSILGVQSMLLKGEPENESLNSIDQAFRGPLYPQGPEPLLPVFYEIRINRIQYEAIISAGAQAKSPDELNCVGQDSGCTPFSFPLGSTEVKAAWKALSDDEVSSGRFFHQELQVFDQSDGTCSVRNMGLVGLHIARKVSQAVPSQDSRTRAWAWSTFEQNDNVPPPGDDGSSANYSFYNADCKPMIDDATCAKVAAKAPNPDEAYQCCENLYRYAAGPISGSPTPDQVTRLDEPPPETQACNSVYDPLDKGVFNNYSLIVTQWPKKSDGPPFTPTITPAYARNAVIETYFTKWHNGRQVNTSSCMGCHGGSSAVDMSYLFLPNVGKRGL